MSKNVIVSGEELSKPRPIRRVDSMLSPTNMGAHSTVPRPIESPRTEGVGPEAPPPGEVGAPPADLAAPAPAPDPNNPEGARPTTADPASPTPPKPRAVFVSKEYKRTGEVPRPIASPGAAQAVPTSGSGSRLEGARPMQNRSEIRDAKAITGIELSLRYDSQMPTGEARTISMQPGMDLSLTRVLVPGSMAPEGRALYQIESVTVDGRQALRPEYQAQGVPTSSLVDASAETSSKFFDLGVCPMGKPITLKVRRLTDVEMPFQGGVMGMRYVPPAPSMMASDSPQTQTPTQTQTQTASSADGDHSVVGTSPQPATPPAPAPAAGAAALPPGVSVEVG